MVKPTTTRLPNRVDSAMLTKHAKPNEPIIVLIVMGIGSTAAFDFRDKEGRYYILRWESKMNGHVIRIPHSIWSQNNSAMAFAIMDQRRQAQSVVVTVDYTPCETAPVVVPVEPPITVVIPKPAPVVEEVKEEQNGSEDALMYGEMPLHEAIAAIVSTTPQRVSALAEHFGKSEEDIRAAIKSEGSTVRVAQAGYVRVIE